VYIRRDADGAAIEPLTITAVRFHRGRPIIALDGVNTNETRRRTWRVASCVWPPNRCSRFHRERFISTIWLAAPLKRQTAW